MPVFVASLFSFKGRLNRARYLAIGLGVGITYVLLNVLLIGFESQPSAAAVVPLLGAWIAGVWIQGAAAVRRLHDLDRPGWHYWLALIPFYGLYLACLLLFVRGTDGSNQYGNDPLGPGWGYYDAGALAHGQQQGIDPALPAQPHANHPYTTQQSPSVQTPALACAGGEWTCPRCGMENMAATCLRCGAADVRALNLRRAA